MRRLFMTQALCHLLLSAEASNSKTSDPKAEAKPSINPPPPPAASSPDKKATDAPAEPVKRVKYPVPEGGLTEFPKDWDPRKHLNLGEKDFADAGIWIDRQIDYYKKRITGLEERKDQIKIYGSNPEALAAAKRAQAIAKRAEALVEDTDGLDGVDAEAILRKSLEAAIERVRAAKAAKASAPADPAKS